jgi:hypothetical protein
VTVPDETFWLALVELVKVANVPRPAMLAAAATIASETSSLRRWADAQPGRRVMVLLLGGTTS